MMRQWSRIVALGAAGLMLAGAPWARAAETTPADPGAPNVAITLTIGRLGGPGGESQRVHRFVGSDGSQARMLVGWRTPIPTTSKGAEAAGDAATMNYVYQNVGVSATLDVRVLGQGRVRLHGEIEISAARESGLTDPTGAKIPTIGTFQQGLDIVVRDGRKTRVAEGPDPDGGTVYLELQATVED